MANPTSGLCPPPFIQESLYSNSSGYILGRFCHDLSEGLSCCLPCPLTDWRYPDGVDNKVTIFGWVAVGLLPLTVFLLLSWAVLPVKFSNRNYITICFTLSVVCLQIPLIIPLGTKPEQCYDEITPNDMHTSWSCAFTGAILLFGGIASVTWSLLRTIALHLQVCWEVIIGPIFMWTAFAVGLAIPVLILTLMFVFTGVSYRYGSVCHINSTDSLDYWIPILVLSGMALVLQFITMGYCINIYVRSLFDETDPTSTTQSGSFRAVTARQAYKRVHRVLTLQWRSITVVLVIIAHVIYLAVTFVRYDKSLFPNASNAAKAAPWLMCLIETQDPTKCTSQASGVALPEVALDAALILVGTASFWNFVFTVRSPLFKGWYEFWRPLFVKHVEYVSVDARSHFTDHNYEMLNQRQMMKSPDIVSYDMRSPSLAYMPGREDDDKREEDIERGHSRSPSSYSRPTMSFSMPRPTVETRSPMIDLRSPASENRSPMSPGGYSWDATATFARSNSQMSNNNPHFR